MFDIASKTYALSTAGTILVNEQNVPYVSHGTPGTVFTVDSLDKARYEAEEYYQDEVPTVKAVMDYVKMEGATSSTVGIIGYTTNQPEVLWPIPGSTVSPSEGYVQNVRNIYVSSPHSVSGYAVPTVDAVYHFIHGTTVEGMTFSSALATAGTMSYHAVEGTTVTGAEQGVYEVVENIVTLDENGSVSVIGSTTAQGYVPEAQAVVDWTSAFVSGYTATAGVLSKDNVQSEFLEGARSGIATVARNIEVQVTGDRSYSTWVVPTVEAVINFIHGDTIYNGGGEYPTASSLAEIAGSTITGTTALSLVLGTRPGTVHVTNDFTLFGGTVTTYNDPQAVPTVKAVADYVRLYGGDVSEAVIGSFTATDSSESWVSGSTAAPGIFDVVDTLVAATTVSTRSISTASVPTVAAVKDYVDGYIGAYTGPFCVNSDGTINGGDVYFAGASICTAAKRTTQMSGTQTIWLVITKTGSTTYSAAWATSATNTATVVSYPIAKCTGTGTSRVFTQLHYGALNITGRWM